MRRDFYPAFSFTPIPPKTRLAEPEFQSKNIKYRGMIKIRMQSNSKLLIKILFLFGTVS